MKKIIQIEWWPIEKVRPYENNPRQNDNAVEAVAASIKEFGFRQPIVVDGEGVIIAGETRWKAAHQLKMKRVPVLPAGDLTPEQVRQYRVADNKLGELATWDMGLLSVELADFKAAGCDLALLGFGADELERILGAGVSGNPGLVDPDLVPAPPDAATTHRGDLWILGNHRLLCGDSASPTDLDQLLDGQRIHLVNTDPPYNVNVEPRSNNAIAAGLSSFGEPGLSHHQGFDVNRNAGAAQATHAKLRPKDRPLINDFVTDAAFDELLRGWFGNIARVLEPGRAFYIWGGYANCVNYPPALAAAELYFSQAIIWVKQHPVLTRKDFMGNHEWCFYGWREGAAHYFHPQINNAQDVWQITKEFATGAQVGEGLNLEHEGGDRIFVGPAQKDARSVKVGVDGIRLQSESFPSDVWSIKKVSPQNMVHLTEKPVELAERAMLYSSRPGENVLDLFGGSGSTLIGAEKTGRKAFLMELDPLYCDVIVQRWEGYTGRKAQRQATATV